MKRLKYFVVHLAEIGDITGLEHAVNLAELLLDGNQSGDISALENLTNLTLLGLWDHVIRDISVLEGLTKLSWLEHGGNPLSRESIDVHIPRLRARGVKVFTADYRI